MDRTPALGLSSFDLDDTVVVREQRTGRLWLLEGERAGAWRAARGRVAEELATPPDEPAAPEEPAPAPAGPPAVDLTVGLGGPAVRVRCWDASLGRTLSGALGPLTGTGKSRATLDLFDSDDGPVLARDGKVLQRPGNLALGRWFLLRHLPVELYAAQDILNVLHASSVALRGGAIVLAASSGSGKTTLAAALVAAGGELVADDITPLEAGTRHVWPLPCAMSIKEGSWPVLARLFATFETCPPVRLKEVRVRYFQPDRHVRPGRGLPVAAIVAPRYAMGAATTMTAMTAPQLLRHLIESGTWPPPTLPGLREMLGWVRAVPAYRLDYGDIDDAVRRVQALAP